MRWAGGRKRMRKEAATIYAEATDKRIDWRAGSHYGNWRHEVGPAVRAVWHTLTNEQKVAIATDAKARAREKEEEAEFLIDR